MSSGADDGDEMRSDVANDDDRHHYSYCHWYDANADFDADGDDVAAVGNAVTHRDGDFRRRRHLRHRDDVGWRLVGCQRYHCWRGDDDGGGCCNFGDYLVRSSDGRDGYGLLRCHCDDDYWLNGYRSRE